MLRDGADFRPKSAPDTLLLENHFYTPYPLSFEAPAHPHTAPHTPTELKQELKLERAASEERNNCDHKESVAEGERHSRFSFRALSSPTKGRRHRRRSDRLSSNEVCLSEGRVRFYTRKQKHSSRVSQIFG